MLGQNPLLRHSIPSGEQLWSHKGRVQTLSYGSFILPNGNWFWKLTRRDPVKHRRNQQCLKAELLLFIPSMQCPMGFLCSSPSGTPRSTSDGGNNVLSLFSTSTHAMSLEFVHQVQACQAHKRNKEWGSACVDRTGATQWDLGKYNTRYAKSTI